MPLWKANEQEQIWNHFEDMLFSDLWANDWVAHYHLLAVYE